MNESTENSSEHFKYPDISAESGELERVVEAGSVLNKVTPLSKYLAMILFIIMPFIGGWIGYTHAPEKVVEVERFVIQEIEKEAEKETQVNDTKLIKGKIGNAYVQGDFFDDWLERGVMSLSFDEENFYVDGVSTYSVDEGTFSEYSLGDDFDSFPYSHYTLFRINDTFFKRWLEPDYSITQLENIKIVEDAFEYLGHGYYRDIRNLYHLDEKEVLVNDIKKTEVQTLSWLSINEIPATKKEPASFSEAEGNVSFMVANDAVYHKGQKLDGINSNTFWLDEEGHYAADEDTVYFRKAYEGCREADGTFFLGDYETKDAYRASVAC
jgi:hypothetical protein